VQEGKTLDACLLDSLESLEIGLLCDWDTLAFLYRHGASLASAEQIARLLGHPKGAIGAALEKLESGGLIERSRGSQGMRLYRFVVPAEPGRHSSFQQLIGLAASRSGRLSLVKELGRCAQKKRMRVQEGLHLA
jgi:hypothetical protein